MVRHTPQQQYKQALQIAQDYGLFVHEKPGANQKTEYQLYRCMATKNVFVGKRSSPEALCALVRKVTNFH